MAEYYCAPDEPLSDCQSVEANGAACQKGCLMQICPNVHNCELTPDVEWCGTSCADEKGGLYWRNLFAAFHTCHPDKYIRIEQPAFTHCVTRHVETLCRPLRGTSWKNAVPGLRH
jgi:hypothetical protein